MMGTYRLSEPATAVVQKANQIVSLAGARTPKAKAVALFLFVRDSIKFGFTRHFDRATPEQTLKSGVGHCNPQGALLASLLQAEGIPARQRFVNLSNGVLRGVLSVPPPRLLHSYVEIQLPTGESIDLPQSERKGVTGACERWIRVDAYIADPALFRAAKARLIREGRKEGHGIHVEGSNEWNGSSDSFCQMADEKSQVTEDLGTFDEPELFYKSPQYFQRLPWPVRLVFGLIAAGANSYLTGVRAEDITAHEEWRKSVS